MIKWLTSDQRWFYISSAYGETFSIQPSQKYHWKQWLHHFALQSIKRNVWTRMHRTNCRVSCSIVPWGKIVWVGPMYNPRIPHYIAANLSKQTSLWTGVGPLVTAFVSGPSSLTNEDIHILFWEIPNPLEIFCLQALFVAYMVYIYAIWWMKSICIELWVKRFLTCIFVKGILYEIKKSLVSSIYMFASLIYC